MRITVNSEYERRIKVAAIGCGGHALRNIFPTFQYAPVELVAMCDMNEQRAADAARLFGAPRIYSDHRAMLEHERPEAVFVVTNYNAEGRPRYPSIAIDAMRAGAHAWIEKPPAASSGEVLEMMQAAGETGRFVGVGFKKMFFPANVKAKEIIERPEFGPVRTITARYPLALPPVEARGDSRRMTGFLDHIVHPHAVLRLLGGDLDSIAVERHDSGAFVSLLRFRNGTVGSLHGSAGQSGMAPLERTEIVGDGANVIIDNNLRVTYYRPGSPEGGYGRAGAFFGADEGAPLHWEPEFSLGQLYNKGLFLLGYAPEIIAFCDAVLHNRAPAKGNLEDALELLRIFEAYRRPDGERVRIARD